MLPDDVIEAAVTAILAVNKFPILRVQDLIPSLRERRLLEPGHVSELELGALTVQLYSAGYDRGMLTSRLAERLQALMKSINDGSLDQLDGLLDARKKDEGIAVLVKVWGVGPTVARTAWALMVAGRKPAP